MANPDPYQQNFDSLTLTLVITPEARSKFQRLDHFLAQELPDLSRSFIKKLFELGEIGVDGDPPDSKLSKLSLSKMPPPGTQIFINIPPPIPLEATPENIPLEILYEDEHLIFLNKPAGLVTHPAPGNYTGTLVNALLHHCPDLQGIGGVKRPGIVHRLDKGTSGVMVVAKAQKCHEELILLFSQHKIERVYEAIAIGEGINQGGQRLPLQKIMESTLGRHTTNRLKMMANPPRGGKKAVTHFKLLRQYGPLTHCEFKLETGRTHQIRVHMSSLLKAPLLMDPLYGKPHQQLMLLDRYPELKTFIENYEYPFLHAKTLGLIHPIEKKLLQFTIPAPSPFKEVIELLQKEFPK